MAAHGMVAIGPVGAAPQLSRLTGGAGAAESLRPLPPETRRIAPKLPEPPRETKPSPTTVSMVLYDLQSGIRKAEALLQTVSAEPPTSSTRLIAAKAYSLEMQAQRAISRLHTEISAPFHEWYAQCTVTVAARLPFFVT